MKYTCEVIQDLLPLYKDEVCSDESKKIFMGAFGGRYVFFYSGYSVPYF